MQRDAVHNRGHSVLTDTEMQVAAIRLRGPRVRGDGFRTEGISALDHSVVGACKVGGAAPHLRQGCCQRLDSGLRCLTSCQRFSGLPGGEVGGEALRKLPGLETVEELLLLRVGRGPLVEFLLPLSVLLGTALGELAGVRQNVLIDVEMLLGIEAEDFLGGSDLVFTQGSTVDTAGVHLVGRWVADDRLDANKRWAGGFGAGGFSGSFEGLNVFAGFHGLHVPAIGLVALDHVLVEGNIRIVLNRDAVVIPKDDEVAQLLGACEGRCFSGDAFLQVTVGGDDVDEVIERRLAGGSGAIEKPALLARRHGHTY